jgi:hypothetical protein
MKALFSPDKMPYPRAMANTAVRRRVRDPLLLALRALGRGRLGDAW